MVKVKPIILVGGVLVLCVSSFIGWRVYRLNQPISVTGTDVPNAAKAGDVQAAVVQTKELIGQLREANWNAFRVPRELLHLPDAKYAEDPDLRNPQQPSYIFACMDSESEDPGLAVVSEVYVRRNVAHYQGDRAAGRGEGFYLVGWKDGTVTQVPVDQVRMYRTKRGSLAYSFPGMKNYDQAKGSLPFRKKTGAGNAGVLAQSISGVPDACLPQIR